MTDNDRRADEFESELRGALAPGLILAERIGAGGMGIVYRARDPQLRRDVAVKVLAPLLAFDEESLARFEREAAATASVRHPNVVSIYHVGSLPKSGAKYFTMELIEGPTLRERIQERGALPGIAARRVIAELAAALATAHRRDLVHRDVKPENVILDVTTGRAVLLDFGISALRVVPTNSQVTQEGVFVGTPTYMSPEQVSGEAASAASDVYNLGVVAFELICGRLPFEEATPIGMMSAHLRVPAPPVSTIRPDVDRAVSDLVDRCLAKSPAERPSAAQVAAALGATLDEVIEWPPPGLDALLTSGRSGRRLLIVAAAVGLVYVAWISMLDRSTALDVLASGELWAFTRPGGARGIWGSVFIWVTFCWTVLLSLVVVSGLGILARCLSARRVRYPWRVIAQVLAGLGTDYGALLNRIDAFSLLGERKARVWRRRRYVLAVLRDLSLLIATASPLVVPWVFVRDTGDNVDSLVAQAAAQGWIVLLALGALAFPAALWIQRGGLRSRDTRVRLFRRVADPPASVVRTWLERAGGAPRESSWLRRWPGTLAQYATLAAIVVVACSIPVVLVVSTFVATEFAAAIRLSSSEREAAERWMREGGSTLLLTVNQSLTELAPASTEESVDVEAMRFVVAEYAGGIPAPLPVEELLDRLGRVSRGQPLPRGWMRAFAVRAPGWQSSSPINGQVVAQLVPSLVGFVSTLPEPARRTGIAAILGAAARIPPEVESEALRDRLLAAAGDLMAREATSSVSRDLLLASERIRNIRQQGFVELRKRDIALQALAARIADVSPEAFIGKGQPPLDDVERARVVAFGPCYSPYEMAFGAVPGRAALLDSLLGAERDIGRRYSIQVAQSRLQRLTAPRPVSRTLSVSWVSRHLDGFDQRLGYCVSR